MSVPVPFEMVASGRAGLTTVVETYSFMVPLAPVEAVHSTQMW